MKRPASRRRAAASRTGCSSASRRWINAGCDSRVLSRCPPETTWSAMTSSDYSQDLVQRALGERSQAQVGGAKVHVRGQRAGYGDAEESRGLGGGEPVERVLDCEGFRRPDPQAFEDGEVEVGLGLGPRAVLPAADAVPVVQPQPFEVARDPLPGRAGGDTQLQAAPARLG